VCDEHVRSQWREDLKIGALDFWRVQVLAKYQESLGAGSLCVLAATALVLSLEELHWKMDYMKHLVNRLQNHSKDYPSKSYLEHSDSEVSDKDEYGAET
jgi:hypothetical protein